MNRIYIDNVSMKCVCFALVAVLFFGTGEGQTKPPCKPCDAEMAGAIGSMCNVLKEIEPVIVHPLAFCEYANVTQLHTMKTCGKQCSYPCGKGKSECFKQHVGIGVTNLKVKFCLGKVTDVLPKMLAMLGIPKAACTAIMAPLKGLDMVDKATGGMLGKLGVGKRNAEEEGGPYKGGYTNSNCTFLVLEISTCELHFLTELWWANSSFTMEEFLCDTSKDMNAVKCYGEGSTGIGTAINLLTKQIPLGRLVGKLLEPVLKMVLKIVMCQKAVAEGLSNLNCAD